MHILPSQFKHVDCDLIRLKCFIIKNKVKLDYPYSQPISVLGPISGTIRWECENGKTDAY